ncbi:hypothetical protein BGS_0452 [Beggiatoa sp. SS]|nr:hypothetical protein BGS_0452 [Beggiatoa sp. SS]
MSPKAMSCNSVDFPLALTPMIKSAVMRRVQVDFNLIKTFDMTDF